MVIDAQITYNGISTSLDRHLMNKKYLLALSLLTVSFLSFKPQAHATNVSAWLPSWDVQEAMTSLESNKNTIDVVSPFWYHVNGDGTLSPTKNSEDQVVIDFAKENNLPIIPTISNSFDGKKITGFLNDEAQRTQNIQNIVNKVLEMNYDGIDIDYEGILSTDMDAFTTYIKELHEALTPHGRKLTIAVMAKSYAMMPMFGERGQDWPELAKYVDEFRIMTYDYGWSGSNPRPVAPHYWVEEVVKYAVDHVPTEKIRLGVPFYAYAWSNNGAEGGKEFYSYTYKTILGIVDKYKVDFQYNPREKTNRLFYLSENDDRTPVAPFEIWTENRVSLEAKLALVDKYHLGGIAIWRLGNEDTENWNLIREHLKGNSEGAPLYFEDVNASTPHANEINRLAFLGLVRGQGKTGLFDPLSKVNRAEILKMSLNSFAVDTSKYLFPSSDIILASSNSPFPDVGQAAWYFPYAQTGVDTKIVNGYPDGTFKPGNNIIRVEALKMSLESAKIDLSKYDHSLWYSPYQAWAIDHGLYTAENFVPGEEITRAEAAYIMAKVIEEVEREPQYSVFNKEKI